MNELLKSILFVSQSPLFFLYMGLMITFGMIVGAHLDEGLKGFKRSITIIMPFLVMALITTLSRVAMTTTNTTLNFQAFNGTVSLLVSAIFYIVGLFIGHMITCKAAEAVKGKDDSQSVC